MSPKAPVSSSSDPQTSSAIELTTTSIPFVRDKNQNNYVLYSQNTIQNDATIPDNDKIQSCDTARKQNYIIPNISTPNHHTQRISNKSSSILNLNTPTILPPVGKQYMCFMKEVKTAQAARCIKFSITTKVIDYFLYIDKFEQQYVVLKGMLQSLQPKDHIQTIGIDQSLSNNAIYEQKCLEKSKNYTNKLVSVTTRKVQIYS